MRNMSTQLRPDSYERRAYSVRGLANWILDLADAYGLPITNMALNKLAFFACERVLLEQNALLTNAKIEAWEHGPVFREIYQAFKQFGDKPITDRAKFFLPITGKVELVQIEMTPDDDAFLTAALLPLLPLSGSRLRALSHIEGGAWHCVWWHDGEANPGMEITPDTLIKASLMEQSN